MLYAIGGFGSDTVEYIYVGYEDITDIQYDAWAYIDGTLATDRGENRAISNGDEIIVIGGYYGSSQFTLDIDVINTTANTVKIDGTLVYGMESPSVIIANNQIYIFGGYDDSSYFNTYQKIVLPYVFYQCMTIYVPE